MPLSLTCGALAVGMIAVKGRESSDSFGHSGGGRSFSNAQEARLAVAVANLVLRHNEDVGSVAILTPYNGQVSGAAGRRGLGVPYHAAVAREEVDVPSALCPAASRPGCSSRCSSRCAAPWRTRSGYPRWTASRGRRQTWWCSPPCGEHLPPRPSPSRARQDD